MTDPADPTIYTLARYGKVMEVNALLNIPYIAQSHGVKDWRGKMKGIPAIVVGAGPSLDADIDKLVGLERSALIIATDRALKPILAKGIKPHVTVSADMEEALYQLYANLDIPEDLVLLYDRDAFHSVIKNYKGPRLTYDTYFDTGIWSRAFIGTRGFLHKNGSVSHTAFYLAAAAKCDPIIFIGVDNAFPGAVTHAKGVSDVDGGAINPADPSWTTVEDVNGNPVRSTRGFTLYAKAFEEAIKEQQSRVINTSQIGAKIHAAEQMTFEKASALYLTGNLDIAGKVVECLKPPPPLDTEMFELQSIAVKASLEHIKTVCDNGYRLLMEASRLDRAKYPERFHAKIERAAEIRKELLDDRFAQSLLGKMAYKVVYIAERINASIKDLKGLDPKRLTGEAAKLECLFTTEKDAAEAFIECLEKSLEALEIIPS